MNNSLYTDQQELRLTGQAANAKLGAVLCCDEQVFYMDGLQQWGDYVGKTLTISGFLRIIRQETAENQPISSQSQGDIFIVQSWKIVG